MSTEPLTLKAALVALVRIALAIPPELRKGRATATEVAVQALRHLAPQAGSDDIHEALAEAVGELFAEMGPEAFMEANNN